MKKALCYLKVFGKITGAVFVGFGSLIGIMAGYLALCDMAAKKLAPVLGMHWLDLSVIIFLVSLTLLASLAGTIGYIYESGCCESKPKKKKSKFKKGK